MRPQIPVPSKGQPLRATWGSQVANRVNELCAMAPAGALHREGFGGIGDQALPKNMRDRTGGAGRPMPFDITAKLQSNQDGTQKRLVIACINGAVNWCGPGFTAHQDDTPGVLTDVAPEITVYTGEWASAISSGTYTVFLNYKLSLAPEWDTAVSPLAFDTSGTKIYQKITAEKIAALNDGPSTLPYGNSGLYFQTGTQVLVSWLRLGKVTVSSSGAVSVTQAFHGDLLLSDLLTITEDGGGGGGGVEDTTNGCWSIAEANDSYIWLNKFVMFGANLVEVSTSTTPVDCKGKFVAVVFGGASPTLQVFDTVSELIEATNDVTLVTVPIGKINADGSGYDIDFRLIPHVSVWDTYTAIEEEEEEVST